MSPRRNEASDLYLLRGSSQDGLFQQRQLFFSPNVFTIQPLELPVSLILNKTLRLEPFQ
jgi:hypothetical protein